MIKRITKRLFNKYGITLAAMTSKVLTIVKDKSTPSEALKTTLQKSEEALTKLNDAITKMRRNEFTMKAYAADENRDALYLAIVLRLESDMLCYYDPQVQQSAKDLYEIITNNGRKLKRGASDESNQLSNLFKKFDEKVGSFQNNSLETIYSNLKKAESEFLNFQNKIVEKNLNKKDIPNLRVAADNLIEQINEKLFTRLNMEAEDNPGQYDEAISLINGLIEKTESIQRVRIARNDTTDEPLEVTEENELQKA